MRRTLVQLSTGLRSLLFYVGIGALVVLNFDNRHGLSQESLDRPAQPDQDSGEQIKLSDFRPIPMVKGKQTVIRRAKFPVVDVHTHFGYRLKGSVERLDEFVRIMDRNNIRLCVSLDGTLGDQFEEHKRFLSRHPGRFAIFANIDWRGSAQEDDPSTWDCHREDFVRRTVEQLRKAHAGGACGLKIFKRFGLHYKNPDGTLIAIDDPRWDPIWKACGELRMPVLIHTADPAAFFRPVDSTNERWEELQRHPDWSFFGPDFPSRDSLLAARNRVIQRHPETLFIGAHVANNSEDLATVSKWLDEYPNLFVEIASRISELGRQPYSAREFFLKYSDRILFGTDGPWPEERLHLYWRFLESYDEYFPYSEQPFPPQGFWSIYGIGLPDDVLKKIYHENAYRVIPRLPRSR